MADSDASRTVAVVALRPVVIALRSHGVVADDAFRSANLDPALLADPEARLDSRAARDLWREAVRLTGDEAFGLHAAEAADATSFDVVGYIGKSSATVGDALRRTMRYARLLADTLALELVVSDGRASLEYVAPLHVPRAAADYRVALLVRLARSLSGRELPIEAVQFVHAEPPYVSEYARCLRIPARFGCRRDAIVFPAALLEIPLSGADERLCAILERQAEQLLNSLPKVDGFRGRVRLEIAAELHNGEATLTRIAERLGISARTLRRKLHDEGTSHQQLLDELRHHLALRYLNEEGRSVGEVAFLLGFADSSAFGKAFRRWTGESPSENRRSRPSHPAPRP